MDYIILERRNPERLHKEMDYEYYIYIYITLTTSTLRFLRLYVVLRLLVAHSARGRCVGTVRSWDARRVQQLLAVRSAWASDQPGGAKRKLHAHA